MSGFEDNFVEESLDVKFDDTPPPSPLEDEDVEVALEKSKRRINRRDAARAAVDALLDDSLVDKTVEVWTDTRG